jgi:hypothetical protein
VLKGMAIDQAENITYGSRKKDGHGVDGLATRFNKVDDKTCFSMGGTGDKLTSLYLAAVGEDLFHLLYPRAAEGMGIKVVDNGRVQVIDGARGKYYVLEEEFKHDWGIAIEHPYSVLRVCNIDTATLNAEDRIWKVFELKDLMPPASTYVLYCNSAIKQLLHRAAAEKTNVIYPTQDPWGKPLDMLGEFRIRNIQAIRKDEAVVPAAA